MSQDDDYDAVCIEGYVGKANISLGPSFPRQEVRVYISGGICGQRYLVEVKEEWVVYSFAANGGAP